MRALLMGVIVGTSMTMSVTAYGGGEYEGWLTDFAKAKATATETKLPVLAVFAGTDWCAWCKKLNKEVLAQEEFKKYAKENVILFLADFPEKKEQDAKVAEQNKQMADQYAVRGFPTVILLDAKGQELGRTEYRSGGAEAYVKHLKDLLAAKESKKS
jgi:protein disulfide-isomerase